MQRFDIRLKIKGHGALNCLLWLNPLLNTCKFTSLSLTAIHDSQPFKRAWSKWISADFFQFSPTL